MSGDLRRGIWLGLGAHTLWGLSPVYWNLVDGVPAIEILAHRVAWSVPALVLVLLIGRRLRALPSMYRSYRTVLLAVVGAGMLAVNWGLFLWAVVNQRIVEASLGYFMTPLVSVVLGVMVLRERLRPAQRVAVFIATVGVVAMTVLHGSLPWVSLALAGSFGTYGLLKKSDAAIPALEGLLGEVVVVAVPSSVFIALSLSAGTSQLTTSTPTAVWLVAAGLMTVAPLWLFGEGVQRIPLSTMGMLQYVAPTLQLVVGVAFYGESLSGGQIVGFASVWVALVVFVRDQAVSAAPAEGGRATLPMSADPG